MDTVLKVCKKEITPKPKLITYPTFIEEYIKELEEILKTYKSIPKYLLRWIALKIIDGEEKILRAIENSFNISIIDNVNINAINLKLKNSSENFKDIIVGSIMKKAENICKSVCTYENTNYSGRDRKIDKILTSKIFGFPIMILFLGIIFWITIVGANYPSELLFSMFSSLQEKLLTFANFINLPYWLTDMLINGIYHTLTWIISVMLPPMAIFFPLFTFLEDLGYLPRIAFNMDGFFKKCSCTGKQMITMCMRFWL